MTANNEIRKAAERVRIYDADPDAEVWMQGDFRFGYLTMVNDCITLAHAYLAEHPSDGTTQPIEIQIPDEAWRDWPDEKEETYLTGKPGCQSFTIWVTHIGRDYLIYQYDGYEYDIAKKHGYRFARISLPKVPEAQR